MRGQTSAGAGPRLLFDYRVADRGGAADLFGLWNFSPAPRAAASFAVDGGAGVAEADNADSLVWRVELPPDYGLAVTQLLAGEERLSASERALTLAAEELAGAAASPWPAAASRYEGEAAELDALLGLMKADRRAANFDLRYGLAESWESANQQFMEFLEGVQRMIVHYAFVETAVGGTLLSRTVVSWTGDAATVWRATPAAPLLALHERSLALALKSREALLRTFIVVAKGAAAISVGGVLALPVVWRYVREVMGEMEAWWRMTNQT